MSSSQDIVQQYIDGQVVPAELAGQDAATKTYVNGQLAQRDTAISAATTAAGKAQSDIDTHKADNTVHVQPSEKAAYSVHIADSNIHVTPTDKTNWNSKAPGSTQTDLATHTGNADIHTTLADKNKLAGISAGAEVNQSAFSYVNDVSATAKTDTLFIVGGIGITVSTDPATKKVTITATGNATPGPHASTHVTGGSDVIPNAVTNGSSGLMSGADAQFVRVDGETKTGAQTKADAVQTNLTTHTNDNSKHVPHIGTTTNTGDAYSITTTETISTNQKFTIKFNAASTTAPTLKVNSGTAAAVKKANGNNAKLYASVYTLFWDGTNFTLLGEGGEYGTAVAGDVRSTKNIGTETGLVTGTLVTQSATAQTITPGTTDIVKAAGIYDGAITVKGDANLVASKIPVGTTIFGVVGSLALGKKFSSGSVTQAANLPITVTGLSFTPSLVIAIATDNSCTIIGSSRSFGTITNDNSNRYGGTFYQGVYNQSGVGDMTTNPMTANGFSITPYGQSGTKTFNWYAYE